MSRLLLQLQYPEGKPTLDQIKAEYGLSDDDLDPGFGVVLVDPRDGTYAVRVDEQALAKLGIESGMGPKGATPVERDGDRIDGPFSDPKIEPTGLSPRRSDTMRGE